MNTDTLDSELSRRFTAPWEEHWLWIDVLSRLLLLTLKSMAINIHLLLATQHPVLSGKTFEHRFPNGNHELWSVLQSPHKDLTGLVTQSACSVRYQKVFLKTCFQLPIPLTQSIHITSDPRMKNYFGEARAKTEDSVSPERKSTDQEDNGGLKQEVSTVLSEIGWWLGVSKPFIALGLWFPCLANEGVEGAQRSLWLFQKTPTQPQSFVFSASRNNIT